MDKIFAGDKAMWVVIVVLLIYSLFVVYSTTAYENKDANQELAWQLVLIGISMVGFFTLRMFHWRNYRPLIKYFYWLSLALTLLMLFKHDGSGAARSLDLGGFDFQPFEMLKFTVVLMVADQLAKRQKQIDKIDIVPPLRRDVWFGNFPKLWAHLREHTIPILGPVALACCVTIVTSNSTTVLIALSSLLTMIIGRVRWVDLGRTFVLASIVASVALVFLAGRLDTGQSRLAGYSPNMFTKYAKVESDNKEYYKRPAHELEQTTYAKMSIATGGVMGKGPGQSTNRLLQEADKDFVFAFLIEEYGLVGGVIIVLAFLIMFYRTMEIFCKCGTAFPGLVVLGLGTTIVLQAFIHICVSVSLLPITGQQLPIVSRGGSSLLFTMAALGLIMGISARADDGTLDKPRKTLDQ